MIKIYCNKCKDKAPNIIDFIFKSKRLDNESDICVCSKCKSVYRVVGPSYLMLIMFVISIGIGLIIKLNKKINNIVFEHIYISVLGFICLGILFFYLSWVCVKFEKISPTTKQ